MLLEYTDINGQEIAVEVGKVPITVGRSSDADLVLQDDRLSRLHCRVFYEKGFHYIKDLKSRNGTYVNDHRVETSLLKSGDRIRLGQTVLQLRDTIRPGTRTVLHAVQEEMNSGKGFRTILREVVDEVKYPE